MKRIVTFIMAVAMMFMSAGAAETDFLSELYNNYTSDYTLSVSFESGDDIAALLEEVEMPDTVNNFVDVKTLLKSLLSLDTTMNLKADISEDFTDIEIGITSETTQNIDVNKNLNIGLSSKAGMWMKINLEESVFEIIYSHPFLNKYMHIDLFEMLPVEEAETAINQLKTVFNKEYMQSMQEFSAELIKKYADVKLSGTKCTVKIDNEALISMAKELMPFLIEKINETIPEEYEYLPATEELDYLEIFDKIQLLGDEGITYEYSLKSGKISKADVKADISLDISKIYEMVSGEEWVYNAKGMLDFKLECTAELSDIDKTKVEFPTLTEENSFSFADMINPVYGEYEEYTYEPTYPHYYVSNYTENVQMIDGDIYVPVRETVVAAYEDTAVIEYDKGVIKITCGYFPGFKVLEMTVGTDKAYLDGQEREIGNVIVKDGISYVKAEAIEEIFGWEMTYMLYDILSNEYNYGFMTEME